MISYPKGGNEMTIKVDIFGKNLEVSKRIQEYVEKKVSKLDKFLNSIDDTRVDLSFDKNARSSSDRNIAQITIRGRKFILRTEERADDIFAAIDASVDKMQRQIERFKGKRERVRGEKFSTSEISAQDQETEFLEEEEPIIARHKQFTLIPMNALEAIEQMKLLGHENFFVFYNADTSSINVLYTRRDGTYGLIEPKIG
jgi:putative sigma-54 modulation protein